MRKQRAVASFAIIQKHASSASALRLCTGTLDVPTTSIVDNKVDGVGQSEEDYVEHGGHAVEGHSLAHSHVSQERVRDWQTRHGIEHRRRMQSAKIPATARRVQPFFRNGARTHTSRSAAGSTPSTTCTLPSG